METTGPPSNKEVGYLNRFQGCLVPYTNTGTIYEMSEISHPRPDIPVQDSAIRFVHSHGVHCSSKRGGTDSHTQASKDPIVPRRLVGEPDPTRFVSSIHNS